MLFAQMRCTFHMLELQGLLESNSSSFWPYDDPWYGYSAVQCLQSEREALEGFLVWESEVIGVFFVVREYVWVCVCICECVGLYVRVGFFIVPGGYGFGKANLGLRALGPCQAHQPISYAIRYRTATACIHTLHTHESPIPPPFLSFPWAQSCIHLDFSDETHCTWKPVTVISITKMLIYCTCPPLKMSMNSVKCNFWIIVTSSKDTEQWFLK